MSDEEETLTDGMDTSLPEEQSAEEVTTTIPDGFDDVLYDTETQSLRMDKVKERFDEDAKQIESYKKQALDMRRKLSKGVETPESADAYEYTPDEKYDKYVLDETSLEGEHIKETMKALSDFAFNNGLSLEASKNLKSMMLNYMEQVHILDTRSEEEIAKDKAENIRQQRAILGDNAEQVIKENVDFYRERGPFTKEERQYLMSEMSKSGIANNIYRKMREFMNTGTTYDIPATADFGSDVEAMRKEYFRADTSDKRREEIIKQSISEGWKLV
jgi:hypothetical protein